MWLDNGIAAKSLLNPNISFQYFYFYLAATTILFLLGRALFASVSHPVSPKPSSALATFSRFFYASFLKPHSGDGTHTGQQAALESFYKAQVCTPLNSTLNVKKCCFIICTSCGLFWGARAKTWPKSLIIMCLATSSHCPYAFSVCKARRLSTCPRQRRKDRRLLS